MKKLIIGFAVGYIVKEAHIAYQLGVYDRLKILMRHIRDADEPVIIDIKGFREYLANGIGPYGKTS